MNINVPLSKKEKFIARKILDKKQGLIRINH